MQIFNRRGLQRLAVRVGSTLALATGATLFAGCSPVTVVKTAAEVGQTMRDISQQSATRAAGEVDESYTQSLTPVQAGPGLMVCEPVVSPGAASELTTFGAGCARWLHLHAAGHGELGQTPLWGQAVDAQELLNRKDLRITSADAGRYASLLGVTHLAIGNITGNAAQARLSYQLYQVHPQQKAIGAPIVISGSQAQIVAALPQTARALAMKLGVKNPRVPALQLAPAEINFLGQVPWKARRPVQPEVANRLAGLAAREPLAGVLFFRSGAPLRDKKQCRAVIDRLMKKSSGNTLVTADVAQFFIDVFKPYEKNLAASRKRFPNNYLLANSEMHWQWKLKDWNATQNAAEDAVRAAPRNPLAWLGLENYLSERARDIRQAKFTAKMTRQERQAVSQLYPKALAAALRATQISPLDSTAWQRVAVAATFDGHDALADKALWKSLELNNANSDAYGWGLQMYQPKWGGDEQKLLRVARMAVQNANPDDFPGGNLEDAIFHGGIEEQREELFMAALQRSPRNAIVNYNVGAIYHYNKRQYKKAEKYYRVALASKPKYARALGSLGDLHYFVKRDIAGAGRLYRQAVALAPKDSHLQEKLSTFEAGTGGATGALPQAAKH